MISNSNIFVGDKSYKTNFFLQFYSNKSENKYSKDLFKRTRYILTILLVLHLLLIIVNYF